MNKESLKVLAKLSKIAKILVTNGNLTTQNKDYKPFCGLSNTQNLSQLTHDKREV